MYIMCREVEPQSVFYPSTVDFRPSDAQLHMRERVVMDLQNFVRQIYPGEKPKAASLILFSALVVVAVRFLS